MLFIASSAASQGGHAMDGSMIQGWLTLGLTTAGTAIHAHGYVRDHLAKRKEDATGPGNLAPERALVGAFHHIAGCNVSFSAIENIVACYGIDRKSALYLQNRKELLIDKADQERFDWYYGDLQKYARRLNQELETADHYLTYTKDPNLQRLLSQLMEIERELRLIQYGGRQRTIEFIAGCISRTFAKTQTEIGASLHLSISRMSIKLPEPGINIPKPKLSGVSPESKDLIETLDRIVQNPGRPRGPGVGGPSVGGP
jgi:hypothetical protein